MQLQITKEKVLEAASKCDTAKATLKVLFPEAFDFEKTSEIRVTEVEGCNPYGLMIAYGAAPPELRHKSLAIETSRCVIAEYNDHYLIIPKQLEHLKP